MLTNKGNGEVGKQMGGKTLFYREHASLVYLSITMWDGTK